MESGRRGRQNSRNGLNRLKSGNCYRTQGLEELKEQKYLFALEGPEINWDQSRFGAQKI